MVPGSPAPPARVIPIGGCAPPDDAGRLALSDEETSLMEWVGVIIWVLVGTLALPVALTGSLTSIGLGVQSLFVVGGLAACVLFLLLDGPMWPAWVSAGLGLAAVTPLGGGAARLTSEGSGAGAAGGGAAALSGAPVPPGPASRRRTRGRVRPEKSPPNSRAPRCPWSSPPSSRWCSRRRA